MYGLKFLKREDKFKRHELYVSTGFKIGSLHVVVSHGKEKKITKLKTHVSGVQACKIIVVAVAAVSA